MSYLSSPFLPMSTAAGGLTLCLDIHKYDGGPVRSRVHRAGVGATESPFVNFSVSKFLILLRYLLDSLHHIHIWQVSPAAQLRRQLSNMKVVFNR